MFIRANWKQWANVCQFSHLLFQFVTITTQLWIAIFLSFHFVPHLLVYIRNNGVALWGLPSMCAVVPLHWRHNDHDGISNHQPYGCLLNCLFGRRSKKTSKLRVTGLCAWNSPGPVNSPHKWPVTRKMFPFDDVIMVRGYKSTCDRLVAMAFFRGGASGCWPH